MGTDYAPLEPGRRIGKYRLVYPIGEGGMSVVYLADDEVLDRKVAIKVLHRHLAKDPEARARFTREARAVARLTHRNIPEIYDFSDANAAPSAATPSFIVSEFVDGAPLSRILRDGIVSPAAAGTPALLPELGVMLCVGIARALAHAHAQSVVHRDVKPENVLVGKDGVVKLTDFGIAQIRGLESMTMTGTLIGSPAHMAPEQIETSKDVDHRADIWGLGTVLYMAVTGGKLPFEADNPHRLLKKIVDGAYTDPRRLSPHVDARLAEIIGKCLVVDRERRYMNAGQVAEDLTQWLAARGFGDVEPEIRRFMADPEGTGALLSPRIAAVLMTLGDDAVARGDRSAALEHFGRVLVLDPERDEALVKVRKLERQLRTRRGARWLLVGVGAVGVAAAVTLFIAERAGDGDKPAPVSVAINARALSRAALPHKRPDVGSSTPTTALPDLATHAGSVFGGALAATLERFDDEREGRSDGDRDAADGPHDRGGEGSRPTERPDRDKPPRAKAEVPVRITVYPPAVVIRIDNRRVNGGAETTLLPGSYTVTLTHSACPECETDVRTLVVPEARPGEPPKPIAQHYVFERKFAAGRLEPATLFVECSGGEYVTDPRGRRYECNVLHTLAVSSPEPELVTFTAHAADGARLGQRQFTLSPRRPIVWPL